MSKNSRKIKQARRPKAVAVKEQSVTANLPDLMSMLERIRNRAVNTAAIMSTRDLEAGRLTLPEYGRFRVRLGGYVRTVDALIERLSVDGQLHPQETAWVTNQWKFKEHIYDYLKNL